MYLALLRLYLELQGMKSLEQLHCDGEVIITREAEPYKLHTMTQQLNLMTVHSGVTLHYTLLSSVEGNLQYSSINQRLWRAPRTNNNLSTTSALVGCT